jgi:hypothetical protein
MFILFFRILQNITMMKRIILSALFGCGCWFITYGQEQFFKSNLNLTEHHMKDFYSSVAIEGNSVAFVANDWTLYIYDKATMKPQWSRYLGRKINIPPFVTSKHVITTGSENVVIFNLSNGEPMDTIPIDWFETKPVIREGILYCTGIQDGGRVFAYDMAARKIAWSKFIAHGYSVKPEYLADRIVANAEGNYWVALSYDGKLLDCKNKPQPEEVDEIPEEDLWAEPDASCREEFELMTHDGVKIRKEKLSKLMPKGSDYVGQVLRTPDYTLAMDVEGTHILVLGNKGKKAALIDLVRITTASSQDSNSEILKAEGNNAWVLYNQSVIVYDFIKKTVIDTTDLSAWDPHQVVVDGQHLWLISKKDGQLYVIR